MNESPVQLFAGHPRVSAGMVALEVITSGRIGVAGSSGTALRKSLSDVQSDIEIACGVLRRSELGLWRRGVIFGADFCRPRDRAGAFLVPRSRRRAGVLRAADPRRRFVQPPGETRRTLAGRSHLSWVL